MRVIDRHAGACLALCVVLSGCVAGCQAPLASRTLPPPPVVDVAPLTPGVRAQLSTFTGTFAASPTDPGANRNLAKVLMAYEIYGAADGYLQRASVLNPQDPEAPYLLGWLHATTGDREAAVADFDRVLRLQPRHPQAMLRRADALRRLGRLPDAGKAFREILKLFPDQPNARFGLGSVLASLDRNREAIAILEPLTAAYGQYGAAHYTLAMAYRGAGDQEGASRHLAAYEGNRTWEPEFEDPAVEAVKDLDRSHQGLYRRSLRAGAAGRWAEAAQLLEEATSVDPAFLVGHINLITCYGHLGDLAKVDAHYRRALALSPNSAELQNTRGLVDKVGGRPAEARAHFLKAIEFDPNHYTSYENLGHMSFEAGDLAAAKPHYERAASIAPWSAISWVRLGTIHLAQGRQGEAREAFLRVVRPGPDADVAIASVREAYGAARDAAGWASFAREAAPRASKAGMASVLSQLGATGR